MTIKEIVTSLEIFAPPVYQETYDNSGLLVGQADRGIEKVLVCLDSTEAVLDEAIALGAGLIVAHHPIIFSGLKRLNGKNYVERVVIKAIQNNIGIYAIHTNLDNVPHGVNQKMGEKLGLKNLQIIEPKTDSMLKLVTYAPSQFAEAVLQALFAAGAGHIGNYSECSFSTSGTGSYTANELATPFLGEKNVRHFEPEERLEVVVPIHQKSAIISALKKAHPYQEVAYDLFALQNTNHYLGAGMVGDLETPSDETAFLQFVKSALKTDCVRHTALLQKPVSKVAFCGGSGSFLLNNAIAAGADVFITADFKYHQFFDADGKILIADVGHYESEQFTIELLADYLMEKFPTFAVLKTGVNTNPIAYV